jgi:hypothetical protein
MKYLMDSDGAKVKKVVFDEKKTPQRYTSALTYITLQWSELGLNDEGEKRWYFIENDSKVYFSTHT